MENEQFVVLSCLGPDRRGLVAQVTDFVTSRGGNIEDSRMAVFGAEFGIMILVSGAPDKVEAIVKDVRALEEATGLAIALRKTISPEEYRKTAAIPYQVTADSLDHEGIVRAIAGALHRIGTNIV